ncbi:hypothetical protein [Thermogymnomonas acidicola]|uniref:hypothetical protein n=1 Tax=Thermogymnomonas acidicola TaxID=399579 RepID=UPI0009466267|nr:hypothetical protein [Thermogymnomonas acidicola]
MLDAHGYLTFMSNQGTDDHLIEGGPERLEDMHSYRITVRISGRPRTERGDRTFSSGRSTGGVRR